MTRGCRSAQIRPMPTPAGSTGTTSSAMKAPTSIRPTPRPRRQPRRWASRSGMTTRSASAKTRGCRPTQVSSMPTPAGSTGTTSSAMKSPASIRPTPRPRQQPRRWASRACLTTTSATAMTRGCRPTLRRSMPAPAGSTGTTSSAMKGPTSIRPTPRPRRQPRRWASRTMLTTRSS